MQTKLYGVVTGVLIAVGLTLAAEGNFQQGVGVSMVGGSIGFIIGNIVTETKKSNL